MLINIVTVIEARDDTALEKLLYVYQENKKLAYIKFQEVVKEFIYNLSEDYIRGFIDPEEFSLETLVEMLEEHGHEIVYHDTFFYFLHKDFSREIEIDLETYVGRTTI